MMNNALLAPTMDPTGLVQAFLGGKSESTIRAYRQDLTDFQSFLEVESIDAAAQELISAAPGGANRMVLAYKNHLIEKKYQPTTINRRLSAIRALVRLARMLGLVSYVVEIPNQRIESYRDTRGPGRYMVQRIMGEIDTRLTKGIRDYAIVRLLFDLALRRGEVVALDYPEDVELESGVLHVLGKGKTQKTLLSMPEPTKDALATWIERRGSDPGPLFLSLDHRRGGGRLTGRSVDRDVIKPLGRKLGIHLSPHGLRHTAITEACKAAQAHGIGLEEILDFSRHKDVKTLMVYRDRERNVQGKIANIVSQGLVETQTVEVEP